MGFEEAKTTNIRVWCGLFYPESTKPNWEQLLSDALIPCAVSPLHDKDVYENDEVDADGTIKHRAGEFKKPHRHIVFQFGGPKSFKQVWDILRLIAVDPEHCPPPERPYTDIKHCVRYLTHYDHKNKAQYLRSDIVTITGFDAERYFRLNSEEETIVFDNIMDMIEAIQIGEYWDLMKRLRLLKTQKPIYEEMYIYARSHTIVLTSLLRSYRHSVLDKPFGKFATSETPVVVNYADEEGEVHFE